MKYSDDRWWPGALVNGKDTLRSGYVTVHWFADDKVTKVLNLFNLCAIYNYKKLM